jgi:flagellar hook protein FlgE
MFGSIYIGLTGLNAFSDGLKEVSNNVSNLNTVGYKATDIAFSDLFGANSVGGLEFGQSSQSSGHGVSLEARTINFSQGELRQTDRDLDLAVDGSGFLVLLDGDQTFYARTGSFVVDEEGFVVLGGTDFRLAVLDASGRAVAVNIDSNRTNPPEVTSRITFADNLSSTATSFSMPDVAVFDERGEEAKWTLAFSRQETVFDEWTITITQGTTTVATRTLKFAGGTVDPTTAMLEVDRGEGKQAITLDFSSVTSFSSGTVSSLRASDINGHATGSIATLAINELGELQITYTNEEKTVLGALALADFRDPQKLEQRSNGMFAHSGYGQIQYLPASDGRVGAILSRRLEASNVDLGSQFGELILVQRGFQASSQIISASNDMIQQLFGLRGQG